MYYFLSLPSLLPSLSLSINLLSLSPSLSPLCLCLSPSSLSLPPSLSPSLLSALGQGINEVSSLPIITTHPRGGVFDSGSSIMLRCQAQNANLSPVFTHNGVLIDVRDPIRITSTEGLSIPYFVSGFEGEYVCLVRNLVGNVTFTVASAPALVQLRGKHAHTISSPLSLFFLFLGMISLLISALEL